MVVYRQLLNRSQQVKQSYYFVNLFIYQKYSIVLILISVRYNECLFNYVEVDSYLAQDTVLSTSTVNSHFVLETQKTLTLNFKNIFILL